MESIIEQKNNVHVIKMSGNFLAENQGTALLNQVDTLIDSSKSNFVIDLSGLKFINSSGLSFMLRILTKARRAGGDVILTRIPDQFKQLLVITKLNAVFSVSDTLDSALASFGK